MTSNLSPHDFEFVRKLPPVFHDSLGKSWAYFQRCSDWPKVDELNAAFFLFQGEWLELNDVRFLPQPHLGQRRKRKLRKLRQEGRAGNYDTMIATEGRVWTRPQNWHDLFNALVWLSFPRSKLALHQAGHEAATLHGRGKNRSATNDRLTIFDEGGLVLAAHEADFAAAWEALQEKDHQVKKEKLAVLRTAIYGFGHGLLEALTLQGNIVNAFTLLLPLSEVEWGSRGEARLEILDTRLEALLREHGTRFDSFPYIASYTVDPSL